MIRTLCPACLWYRIRLYRLAGHPRDGETQRLQVVQRDRPYWRDILAVVFIVATLAGLFSSAALASHHGPAAVSCPTEDSCQPSYVNGHWVILPARP